MKLEEIGFYTLSDNRVRHTGYYSDLMRGEIILTDKCNFKCPYCRGIREDCKGTMPFKQATKILQYWFDENLQNIRFSGGEPTLYPRLTDLVNLCRKNGVKRIALSTNGSADWRKYQYLIAAGVNDFSVSLDACCASVGDMMAGVKGRWQKVIKNIQSLAKKSYVTVGVVVTPDNLNQLQDLIPFASNELGVHDIRIISSAQYNQQILAGIKVDEKILAKHPILKYRIENARKDIPIRGMSNKDYPYCPLVIDDVAVAGDYHFPCIIYLREQGNPIGKIGNTMKEERLDWFKNHNCFKDPICSKNCLDVCVSYSNKFRELRCG
jgi:MoaA/NifB/PqqE/SkfB family radical SAM enzyme